MIINNTFKYPFICIKIKIKIKNERNDIIIMKEEEEEDMKHTGKKLGGYLQPFEVEFV